MRQLPLWVKSIEVEDTAASSFVGVTVLRDHGCKHAHLSQNLEGSITLLGNWYGQGWRSCG